MDPIDRIAAMDHMVVQTVFELQRRYGKFSLAFSALLDGDWVRLHGHSWVDTQDPELGIQPWEAVLLNTRALYIFRRPWLFQTIPARMERLAAGDVLPLPDGDPRYLRTKGSSPWMNPTASVGSAP